jgi:hypothetical protein
MLPSPGDFEMSKFEQVKDSLAQLAKDGRRLTERCDSLAARKDAAGPVYHPGVKKAHDLLTGRGFVPTRKNPYGEGDNQTMEYKHPSVKRARLLVHGDKSGSVSWEKRRQAERGEGTRYSHELVTGGGKDHDSLDKYTAEIKADSAFKKLEHKLEGKKGVYNAAGLAAAIGRKKLGNAEMERRSKAAERKDAAGPVGPPRFNSVTARNYGIGKESKFTPKHHEMARANFAATKKAYDDHPVKGGVQSKARLKEHADAHAWLHHVDQNVERHGYLKHQGEMDKLAGLLK